MSSKLEAAGLPVLSKRLFRGKIPQDPCEPDLYRAKLLLKTYRAQLSNLVTTISEEKTNR